MINAFHADYIKTYHSGLLAEVKLKSAQAEQGRANAVKRRESVIGKKSIDKFPDTRERK